MRSKRKNNKLTDHGSSIHHNLLLLPDMGLPSKVSTYELMDAEVFFHTYLKLKTHPTAGRQQKKSINNTRVPHYILLSTHTRICTHTASNQSALKDRRGVPLCDGPSPVYWVLAGSIHSHTIGIIITQTEGLRGSQAICQATEAKPHTPPPLWWLDTMHELYYLAGICV